ncbi:MAG TPA: hypothetical protein VG817_09640, partial [Gemmatimonadales bacterium]|nr:hypothetical protein [Gemmatimonadales bacterium]
GFGGIVLAAPWVLYTAVRLYHTRRLFAAGYAHEDIIHALDRYIEQRREELAFEYGTRKTLAGRLTNYALVGMVAGTMAGLLSLAFVPFYVREPVSVSVTLAAIASAVLFFARNIVPGARAGARDRLAELARWFWKSKAGQAMSGVARWRLKAPSAPDQVMHRATEVALGQAADALYKALPAAQRKDLKQLPEQISYLAAQAATMRAKLEELDDLIAQAEPDTLFDARPAGDGGASELRHARDMWGTQLRDTVSMLESLRLGLLRLHAGSAQPSELTAELDAARLLRERLDLLNDAVAELDGLAPGTPRPAITPLP